MKQPRTWSEIAVLVGVVAVVALVLVLRSAIGPHAPPPPPPRAPAAESPAPQPAPPPGVTTPAVSPALPVPAEVELDGHDSIDPCNPGAEPRVPADYETTVANGVTLAWSNDRSELGPSGRTLHPVSLAYLAAGVLEEAAALTATPRRAELTVIIHPSSAAFRIHVRAPSWADGAYDGAVELYPSGFDDLGINVRALRHEIMHAQLHASVGCMPLWFNEGLATFFGGEPPIHDWLTMLRRGEAFDLDELRAPQLHRMPSEQAARVYATSVAMIAFIAWRAGDPGLRIAVQAQAAAARQRPPALDLWDRLYPEIGRQALLDALAHHIFGIGRGSELDGVLGGGMCCSGTSSITELRCRAGAPPADHPDRKTWIEASSTPHAMCRTAW